jgi:anti-sigma regulatory factor (Ser/Thr protein kinase)
LLPARPEAPKIARDRVEEALSDHLTPDSLYDVKLMVTELVTNSIRHAGLQQNDRLRLSVQVDREAAVARVEIADRGPGFHPDEYRYSVMASSGRGLDIVRALALRWGVEKGDWSAVWFEVPLRPDSRESGLS